MTRGRARNIVRGLVALALAGSLSSFALTPVPESLPTIALGQPGLYRLEAALLVFYGCLLLITPAVAGLAWGRLPVEISARGAKFTEEAAALNEVKIEELERTASTLIEGLATADLEIEKLKKRIGSDTTQPPVRSKR